jgi:hypothetical protein
MGRSLSVIDRAFQWRQSRSFVSAEPLWKAMYSVLLLLISWRRIRARVMCIAFDIEVAGMHPNDRAADVPGLGIPAHAIADFEGICHNASPRCLNAQAALKFGFAVGLARLRALGGQHRCAIKGDGQGSTARFAQRRRRIRNQHPTY